MEESMNQSLRKHKAELRSMALTHCGDMFYADKVKILSAMREVHTDTQACLDTIFEVVKRARVDTVDLILPEVQEAE
jgi:hypothetical protein